MGRLAGFPRNSRSSIGCGGGPGMTFLGWMKVKPVEVSFAPVAAA
jgi:hypothetical protein